MIVVAMIVGILAAVAPAGLLLQPGLLGSPLSIDTDTVAKYIAPATAVLPRPPQKKSRAPNEFA